MKQRLWLATTNRRRKPWGHKRRNVARLRQWLTSSDGVNIEPFIGIFVMNVIINHHCDILMLNLAVNTLYSCGGVAWARNGEFICDITSNIICYRLYEADVVKSVICYQLYEATLCITVFNSKHEYILYVTSRFNRRLGKINVLNIVPSSYSS